MPSRRSTAADAAQHSFDFDTTPPTGWDGGFMVVHGNRPESLRDLMVAWMRGHPLAPLENEQVLVQSNGIAQWLKLSLAADPAQGGAGIAAAVDTELPARALWNVYRAVLGRDQVPAESPFDKPRLVWRLMRLLPALLERPAFEPLRRFLRDDDDLRKRHQLALRLADLLDQYQVYRADWLARWAAGDDVLVRPDGRDEAVADAVRWQPQLWRELLADAGAAGASSSRAEVHRRFLAAVAGWSGAAPAALARRITVFGISTLPRQSLEVLHAASRWSQVLLCVHNPCEHDWSHIVAEQAMQRARRQSRRPGWTGEPSEDTLHLSTHPLLAAWGRQGRDFIRLLDDYDQPQDYRGRFAALGERVDLFEAGPQDSLLRQLQDDIRELRPLAETRSHWPAVDASRDRSIAFHVAHGRQREVEILHDHLLAAFSADPTLRPRDVIVMVPDVADYAAHVQAVFGRVERDDDRYIPFGLSDRGQRLREPIVAALDRLLSLPQSRVAAGEVLDLLQAPALRDRFGIAEEQLPLVRHWLESAGVRWGLHAAHRESLGLPADLEQNSWWFGLRRMVLGYAVGAGEAWDGIEPMPGVGGLEAALLGPLVLLAQSLEALWRALREPVAPAAWAATLRRLLEDFFLAPDGSPEGLTLLRARAALDEWEGACAAAGLVEPLPLAVVREHWLGALEPPALQQPFFAGGVTFASLMPMRAIPFRRVALLGMNDGDYPRSRTPMDFDLMAGDHRPGDRSRREDDRYLFLEALLSAREHLHVSWVGRSAQDNQERPPSVLVAQLRDHLAAGWGLAGADEAQAGAALLDALTTHHRLQPFHPAYFDGGTPGLFSYAREWRASLEGAASATAAAELAPMPTPQPLTLKQLGDFLRHPARAFLQQRLGVSFREDDPVAQDEEPFGLDGLEQWKLQTELIRVQRTAVDAGQDREPALRTQLDRIARRGQLPHGAFAQQVQQELAEPMERLFQRYAGALADWPQRLDDEPVQYEGGGLRVEDWLDGLRAGAQGRARLVLEFSGLVDGRSWRHERLLPYWVAHLAGHLGGEPLTTIVLSKAGAATFRALSGEEALSHWNTLLQAWQEGMRRPLPFDVQVAAVWLKAMERGGDESRAQDAARDCHRKQIEPEARGRQRESAIALERAHPEFDSLWAGGEFRRHVRELLQPALDAVGKPPAEEGNGL